MQLATLESTDLKGKTIVYRVDYNVPFTTAGEIADTFRIESTYPALEYFTAQGAKMVVISHRGRPEGSVVPSLSLRQVADVLANHFKDREVHFAHKPFAKEALDLVDALPDGSIVLLENIRSEEHTSELQSHHDLVCRLLLEKKPPGGAVVWGPGGGKSEG